MLIISKYKDYYDYLATEFGVDEKLVLDRRSENYSLTYSSPTKVHLFIADIHYQGLWLNDKFYWSNSLLQFGKFCKASSKRHSWESDEVLEDRILLDSKYNSNLSRHKYIAINPRVDKLKRNSIQNKAILYTTKDLYYFNEKQQLELDYIDYPKLSDLNIPNIISSKDMWITLSNWLSKQLDKQITNNQTDKEKIITHGFDIKKSFRHRNSNF